MPRPFLLFTAGTAAIAAERAALVIGNDAYPSRRLSNANDASAVRDLLRDQLSFPASGIVFGTDLSRVAVFDKLEAFKTLAARAQLVVVYYAGHGMESLDGKENFLIPVDVDVRNVLQSEAALRASGVNMMTVIQDLAEACDGAKVILMDCCRERPGGRGGLSRAGGGMNVYEDGKIPADTLMLLAAAPDRIASDGQGHGPFRRALLETLPAGKQNLLDTFFAVSDRVQELTSGQHGDAGAAV